MMRSKANGGLAGMQRAALVHAPSLRRRPHRQALSLGAAVAALSIASGAWGQTAPAVQEEAAKGDSGSLLGEVIVTATRRPEKLHDVPLSVSAFGAEELAKAQVRDNRDLALLTPGLRMEATNNFTAPTIRGVSTTLVGSNADPNVATYIDGIYQEFPQSAIFVLPDVKQIEVLKGPQGTLFGRNATGGAIIISTRDPDLAAQAGSFEASYGSYDDMLVKGFWSQPLADGVAASVAVFGQSRDGWYRLLSHGGRDGGGLTTYLLRAKLRFVPNENTDFTLTGLVSRQLDRSQGMNETLFGNNSNLATPGSFTATRPYAYAGNLIPYTDTRTRALSLRGTIQAGPGYFTTTTAYNHVESPVVFDNDNTNLPIANNFQFPRARTFTQELLYTLDDDGPLHGTVGAYFYSNRNAHYVNVNPGPAGRRGYDGAAVRDIRDASEAQSVFGEFTYDVTPQLSLTGGLRYSRETRKASGIQLANGAVLKVLADQKHTWDSFTPRLSAVYSFDDDHNVYATYSKGFKSGLFNALALQDIPVDPEKITSFEVGSKNRFANFTLDLAAFYYDYTNLQVQSLTTVGVSFVSIVNNAASSKIYGAEANLSWRVTDELRVNAGLSLIHARYQDFQNASVVVPNSATNTPSCNFQSYTPVLTGGYRSLFCDVSDNHLIRTPKATVNVALDYTKDYELGTLNASAIFYWTDTIYYDPINYVKQDPYSTLNAQVGFRPAAAKSLKFSVYGANLTNERVFESVFESTSVIFVRYAPPRQFGVRFNYDF